MKFFKDINESVQRNGAEALETSAPIMQPSYISLEIQKIFAK